VTTMTVFRSPASEGNVAPAFANGFTDGQAARAKDVPLTAYLRVGIDDYAKGFRAGFYDRSNSATVPDRPSPLHVVNL
jgi:hypothetical protein